jgi:hypothetical protein
MRGRVKALFLLALALLRTLWRRWTGPPVDGLARFRENYAEDGLSAVSARDRFDMLTFGRCIACGRCDRGDSERVATAAGHYRGTMSLVLAASRSMPDYRAAAQGFARLTDAELAAKEALCPTRVPIRRIAAFVQAHSATARVSVPAARGTKRLPSSFPPRLEAGGLEAGGAKRK